MPLANFYKAVEKQLRRCGRPQVSALRADFQQRNVRERQRAGSSGLFPDGRAPAPHCREMYLRPWHTHRRVRCRDLRAGRPGHLVSKAKTNRAIR